MAGAFVRVLNERILARFNITMVRKAAVQQALKREKKLRRTNEKLQRQAARDRDQSERRWLEVRRSLDPLTATLKIVKGLAQHANELAQVAVNLALGAHQRKTLLFWADELAKERNAHPKRLLRYGSKVYSQWDEDGIIQEIFRRIGPNHRTFVEFGVQTGIECNTVKLLIEGWRGLWIEMDTECVAAIRGNLASFLAEGRLLLKEIRVETDNINDLLHEAGMAGEIDLLSIDIDYNDYWVWKAIDIASPRVVVIEYNAFWPPPMSVVVPYDPARGYNGTTHFGTSLEALVRLGRSKNYRLVGCSFSGVNAFFVREDLCGDLFLEPATAEEHYEPPRHFCIPHCARPGFGPVLVV